MNTRLRIPLIFFILILSSSVLLSARPILRENMQRALPGDFIVAAQDKVCTLLLVDNVEGPILTLEELVIPMQRLPSPTPCWSGWLKQGAPGHTCWVRYRLNTATGHMVDYYSFTQRQWCSLSSQESLLATLLSLSFQPVPASERKRRGPKASIATHDPRELWQPPLICDGKVASGAIFDVWRSQWPRDGSDLAGRRIEIYLPAATTAYPSYFPYWLEVQGVTGRAKIRVLDSGHGLKSPQPEPLQHLSTTVR